MLTIFHKEAIENFTNRRIGEEKLGQHVQTVKGKKPLLEELQESNASFVLIGVPEDIGVRMNGGNGGAHTSFIPALKAFLNIQQNQFINGKDILVLGYLDYFDSVHSFDATDSAKGDLLVRKIDKDLSAIIEKIIASEKIPIVIGGGHNNAYGNIKGLSLAKKQKVNVINLDAHTDLRRLEERHSGNGFSYALHENLIQKYFMFGLHESYTPQYIFDTIHDSIHLDYNTFEELEVYQITTMKNELQRAKSYIEDMPYGIEIDLDSIQYFPSSAMTPSGFSPQQTRQFVYNFAKNKNASYIHICEGAPSVKAEPTSDVQVGKFISYLIADFIKAKNEYL